MLIFKNRKWQKLRRLLKNVRTRQKLKALPFAKKKLKAVYL
jgi:hypothetical protein